MNPPDRGRLAALARALDLEPRRLFVLAGRVAATGAPLDAVRLHREVALARIAGAAPAHLAMLPFAEYAIDELDRGLMLAAVGPSPREP